MEDEKKEESRRRKKLPNTNIWEKKGSDEYSTEYMAEYKEREASVSGVFEQTLRIVQELQSRVEREMFRGMQYKAEQDSRWSNYDPKINKSASDLGKLVAQLQTIHLRMLKEGERQAKNMSREEQMSACVAFIKRLPRGYQEIILRDINEALGRTSG